MKAMTIRGLDAEMSQKIKTMAIAQKKSVNQLVLDVLRQSVGMQKKKRYTITYDDLDDLFGSWSDEEFERIQKRIENQRKIDPELWK